MSASAARTSKPKMHGPGVRLFGQAELRAHEDEKLRNAYTEYRSWCDRMGLPSADFETWRMTTAHISNV